MLPSLLELVRAQPTVAKRAKPHSVRRVSEATKKTLMDRLLQERKKIVSSHFGYKMLGKELVLPTKCLRLICKKARSIHTEDDIRVPGLRVNFVNKLFNVVMDTLS